jgi:YidC/Oxa1 family membrane protein insertase
MQQKNLLLFCVLSFVILIGWSRLQLYLWPPAPKQPPPAVEGDPWPWRSLPAAAQGEVVGRLWLVPVPPAPGLESAYRLATAVAVTDSAGERQRLVAAYQPKPKEPPPPQPEVVAAAPHRKVPLGNPSYHLSAVLTSRGAGVQSLVLNKFQKADSLGQPVYEEDRKTPAPMELIPDNSRHPSFLLYHYDQPGDPHPDHPVDTLGERDWSVEEVSTATNEAGEEVSKVVFATTLPNDLRLTKTYTLTPRAYHLGLKVEVEHLKRGPGQVARKFRYQLAGGHGLPIEGEWYTSVFRNAMVGLEDRGRNAYRVLEDSRRISFREGGDEVLSKPDRWIRYAGIAVQYFASVIVVSDQQEKGIEPTFLEWARATVEGRPFPRKPHLDDLTMRVISKPLSLEPGARVAHQYVLYNGPVKALLLGQFQGDQAVPAEAVHRYLYDLHLNTLTDHHWPGWEFAASIGWTWLLIQCTNLMHWLLWLLYKLVGHYGLCIILLTILVRGLMFPISRKQALMSLRMQEMAPEMKKLQEKYKEDVQARNAAMMELYRKHGVNPFGTCWVLLLQMPIFLGLYYALMESIHFRLAPFWPLWMRNLAAPDMLWYWGEKIPWISDPDSYGGFFYLGPYLNVLPLIAVALMMVHQALMTPPPADEQQEMQQKMMKYMLIIMGLMFYKVAAGLCIYFIASSLWGLAERKLLPKRKLAPAGAVPAAPAAAGGGRPGHARPKPRGVRTNGQDGTFQKVREWWEEVLKQAKKK